MKTRFPVFAAFALIFLWAVMIVAIPTVMSLFADFKVEMPTLTIAVLRVSHLFGRFALPLFVLMTALLLAFRQFLGWVLAMGLCVAWDAAFIGLMLPIIVLINNLGGGEAVIAPFAFMTPTLGSTPQATLFLIALVSNQVLLSSLLMNQRTFFVR